MRRAAQATPCQRKQACGRRSVVGTSGCANTFPNCLELPAELTFTYMPILSLYKQLPAADACLPSSLLSAQRFFLTSIRRYTQPFGLIKWGAAFTKSPWTRHSDPQSIMSDKIDNFCYLKYDIKNTMLDIYINEIMNTCELTYL